ncbi:MAG: hypothetical protein AAFQ07_13270, partial [Chloroflexota bacterium]
MSTRRFTDGLPDPTPENDTDSNDGALKPIAPKRLKRSKPSEPVNNNQRPPTQPTRPDAPAKTK